MNGSDPEATSFDGSYPEVAVEGRKLAYTVHFTTYKAVARRGRSRMTRMTSRDLS